MAEYALKQTGAQVQEALNKVGTLETRINALSEEAANHKEDEVSHVTAKERNAWNAKSNFSGSYTDLNDQPFYPPGVLVDYHSENEYMETVTIPEGVYDQFTCMAKVSDAVLTYDEIIGKTLRMIGLQNGETVDQDIVITETYVTTISDVSFTVNNLAVVFINEDSVDVGGLVLPKGIWCCHGWTSDTNLLQAVQVLSEGKCINEEVLPVDYINSLIDAKLGTNLTDIASLVGGDA